MSPIAHSLLALAAAALLHVVASAECDISDRVTSNCRGIYLGKQAVSCIEGGETPSPIPFHERYGYFEIPPYGLLGPRVVGQYVQVCNQGGSQAPLVLRDLGSESNSRVFVALNDGNVGRADMLVHVWYYLEQMHPDY